MHAHGYASDVHTMHPEARGRHKYYCELWRGRAVHAHTTDTSLSSKVRAERIESARK